MNRKQRCRILPLIFLAPAAVFAPIASAAQYIPLFPARVVSPSMFPQTDINLRYEYASTAVTAYCDANATAFIKTDRGDGTYGPPIVDNYITAGDEFVSACQGGIGLPSPMSGTNCFNSGATTPLGGPIENTFDASGVTAPVPLTVGANTRTFKLWDYGGVLGNSKLVLEIPLGCSTVNQWCSPGYWKNHPAAWAPLAPAITPQTVYEGAYKYDPGKRACKGLSVPPSLFDVLSNPNCFGGEAANAVADLLSAAHPGVDFYGTRVEGSCPLN